MARETSNANAISQSNDPILICERSTHLRIQIFVQFSVKKEKIHSTWDLWIMNYASMFLVFFFVVMESFVLGI